MKVLWKGSLDIKIKKHLRISRKCFIFSVDQPGLEPGTSRL